jgi:phage host-nuclease inhibitor protein Gam
MAYRKSLVQVKFRLRQDILRKLEREAKRHDRSTNDEIARRLEESFRYGDWQEERQRLVTAMMDDLGSHPDPASTKAALAMMEESAERDLQADSMEEMFSTQGKKS